MHNYRSTIGVDRGKLTVSVYLRSPTVSVNVHHNCYWQSESAVSVSLTTNVNPRHKMSSPALGYGTEVSYKQKKIEDMSIQCLGNVRWAWPTRKMCTWTEGVEINNSFHRLSLDLQWKVTDNWSMMSTPDLWFAFRWNMYSNLAGINLVVEAW